MRSIDPPALELSDALLQSYTGKYYSDEAQAGFTVVIRNGSLYLHRAPQTMILLIPKAKDRFATDAKGFSGQEGEVTFVRDKMLISVGRANGVIFNKL